MNARRIALAVAASVLLALGGACYSPQADNPQPRPWEVGQARRIPEWVKLVADGRDNLRWTADADGQVYVFDYETDHIVYSGPIRRDQEIVVSPMGNRVFLSGASVSEQPLRRGARNQVYFAGDQHARAVGGSDKPGELREARLVHEGSGDFKLAPRTDGIVYVWDNFDSQLIYRAALKTGQTFNFSPQKSSINIVGYELEQRTSFWLNPRHHYQVFFKD
jgi:hypothetical protein